MWRDWSSDVCSSDLASSEMSAERRKISPAICSDPILIQQIQRCAVLLRKLHRILPRKEQMPVDCRNIFAKHNRSFPPEPIDRLPALRYLWLMYHKTPLQSIAGAAKVSYKIHVRTACSAAPVKLRTNAKEESRMTLLFCVGATYFAGPSPDKYRRQERA